MKSVSFKQHDAYPEGPVKSNVEPLDSGVKVDDAVETVDGVNHYVEPIHNTAENLRLGATDGIARRAIIQTKAPRRERNKLPKEQETFLHCVTPSESRSP